MAYVIGVMAAREGENTTNLGLCRVGFHDSFPLLRGGRQSANIFYVSRDFNLQGVITKSI